MFNKVEKNMSAQRSVPGMGSLANPTNFPRVDSIPFDVEQSHGVDTDFGGSNPFGVGGQTTLYDFAKDSNTGTNAVNRPLTYTYLANTTDIGCSDPYYHEALCFIKGPRRHTSAGNMPPKLDILSISALNRYLRQPKQRNTYGTHQTVAKFTADWRFAGSIKRPHRPLITDDAVPIIIGGRARILDLGRAYIPGVKRERLRKGVPGQLDHMFLLYRRYHIEHFSESNEDEFSSSSLVARATLEQAVQNARQNHEPVVKGADCPYMWQVDVFMNRSGKPPEVCLYQREDSEKEEDDFIGDYERVGFVGFVFGDRNFSMESVERARKIIRGRDGYENDIPLLEAVELFTGVS